jgi:hypothetical protein
MEWLRCISYFFGGCFLSDAIPHFVSGVMGRPFQSPFAKPPGQGLSIFDRKRALGCLQLRDFLYPDLSSRRVRLALYGTRGGSGTGVSAHGLDGCAPVWTLPWRQLPRGFKCEVSGERFQFFVSGFQVGCFFSELLVQPANRFLPLPVRQLGTCDVEAV